MNSKGMKLAVSILALTIGMLAPSAHAQSNVTMKFKNISVPGAFSTDAYAINNKNVVAGDYINAAGLQQAMLMKGTTVTPVFCPSGTAATAFYGMNSRGEAVTDDYCGNGAIWMWTNTGGWWHHVLGCPPICPLTSLAINDNQVIAGTYQDPQQVTHAFSFDTTTGAFNSLDLPGGLQVEPGPSPWGLNKAGMMTLQGIDPASGLVHSFLFDGRSFTQIDVPGALQSFVHGINNNGDMVYTVEDANGNSFGVFFYATLRQFYWFNQPDGRHTTRAFGINDERLTPTGIKLKIVGDYSLPGSNQNYAYLATVTITP